MPAEFEIEGENSQPAHARRSLQGLMIGITLGGAASALLALLALAVSARGTSRPVTEESLAAAEHQWQRNGPRDYDLDLRLSGSQTGEIHVEVRNGDVIRMTRDGRAPKQRRTWEYWSIPNQFAMIAQDLESAKSPAAAFGINSPSQVLLRAEFDPQFGYPAYYQRTVLGGSNQVEWRITRFTVPKAESR